MKSDEEKREIRYEYFIKIKLDDLELNDWSKRKWKELKDGYLEGKCSWKEWERYVKERQSLETFERKEGDEEFEGKDKTDLLVECYNIIGEHLDYYMDINPPTKNIIILWIIGSHFHEEFSTYPYLFVNAMRGSGKTRLLKLIAILSNEGQLTTSLTESVMFRTSGTLALDEFEGIDSKDKTALRELLNASYKKGTKVFRMAKKKVLDGETQAVETFEPYRPVTLANIWGMEEVLGDRCINILLEKSNDPLKIKIIEDFEDSEKITTLKKTLNYLVRCSLCSKCRKNITTQWNDFIKTNYTLTPLPSQTTQTTQTTPNNPSENQIFFDKINKTNIEGRHLELFFPLFLIAQDLKNNTLDDTIKFAQKTIKEKKIDEVMESKDVLVYSIVAKENPNIWKDIKDLTTIFKLMIGEELDWINTKWMGRALKRLNLVKEKRRMGKGVQVLLDVEKAQAKGRIFESKDDGRKTEENI